MRTSVAVYLEGATDSTTLRPPRKPVGLLFMRPVGPMSAGPSGAGARSTGVCGEAVMAGVLTVGLVVLLFFAAGAVVGATLLVAWSWWRVIRCSTRRSLGSASSRKRER